MNSKQKVLYMSLGIIQEMYSLLIVAYCIYQIVLTFTPAMKWINRWDIKTIFVFISVIIIIIIHVSLFILAERLTKPEEESEARSTDTQEETDSQEKMKQTGIDKEVAILVLNCIFFLRALLFYTIATWKFPSFLGYFLFFLCNTPLYIIIVLTSIAIKIKLKPQTEPTEKSEPVEKTEPAES